MSESPGGAGAYIASHRAEAIALGERLASAIDEPEAFVVALERGLTALSDPAYVATIERVSPGLPSGPAVRGPLVAAVQGPLRRELRAASSASALSLAQRLAQSDAREIRTFALPCLERSLAGDPERTWQLLRRLGRTAQDWIEVDGMAGLWARGVLAEPFRWAELEQLVYSALPMERRIVGATLACLPHVAPRGRRASLVGAFSERSYQAISSLIGDAEPLVQKSLSWAIREWTRIDAAGTARLLRRQAELALEGQDGHRAWVIRDALSNAEPALRDELRDRLHGIRRDSRAPSSSIAARQAAAFEPLVAVADSTVASQGHRYTRSHA